MVPSLLNPLLPLSLATLVAAQSRVVEATSTKSPNDVARVTVSVKDQDIRKVIDEITKQADANVVVAPEVRGEVTLKLHDVPWRDALDATTATLGYRIVETGPILRIVAGQATPKAPRVYFAFENANIVDVISTISKISGANVVISPEVQGTVSLRIKNVPWRTALNATVETLGYVVDEGPSGILSIKPRQPRSPSNGKLVTANYEGAKIGVVINDIAKQAGANIVISPEVRGTVTLRLRDVPWFDALSAACQTLGYRVQKIDGEIVRVTTQSAGN